MPIKDQLDEDSQRRLTTNPLRIFDSKNSATQALLNSAPQLVDYLEVDVIEHFEQLKKILDAAGVSYTVNPKLVRGLDYYGYTVFEWVTDKLGAQGTVCAGGRYDGLVEQLGGKPTPAVGFAMGIERLVLLLETLAVIPEDIQLKTDVYITSVGDVSATALSLAEQLRNSLDGSCRITTHCGGGSFKNQMKKADKSGAQFAIILGDDSLKAAEISKQNFTVKFLREDKPQQILSLDELIYFFKQN